MPRARTSQDALPTHADQAKQQAIDSEYNLNPDNWVYTRSEDDYDQLDCIPVGHIKGKPRLLLVSYQGNIRIMDTKEWEKIRFHNHQNKNQYGKRVR